MRVEIKICGLSTEAAVKAAADAGADYLGFIFFEKSPRNVSVETAARLMNSVRGRVKTVAVTVNASADFLDCLVEVAQPDLLQFHGNETPQELGVFKKRYGLPVIKAIAVRTGDDLKKVGMYECIADRLLLDAKAPEGSVLPGGNGVQFDWTLLNAMPAGVDYFLSGGLDAGNISEALEVSKAGAIDVSSGVESSPGVKDIEKIAAFIKTVRDYETTHTGAGVPA